jgi:hypothetical protein
MKVVISQRKVVRGLLLGLLLLSCVTFSGPIFLKMSEFAQSHRTELQPLLDIFTVLKNDTSIGAWYSSFLLLFSSVLLAIIAWTKKVEGKPYSLHWAALSIIFLLLSIDEVATIHEALGNIVKGLARYLGFTPQGFFSYTWVVLGAVFVLIVLLAYSRFLYYLPKKTLLLFLAAGALFVGSALGIEMIEARLVYISERGVDVGMTVMRVIRISEEVLESLGVIIFIHALLSYVRSYVKELAVQIKNF